MYINRKFIGRHGRKREQGVALLMALGILAIVYLLGTAYITFMTIETEDVQLATRDALVRATAERGVMASLSEVGEHLAAGETPGDIEYADWPVFEVGPDDRAPEERDDIRARVTVTVVDENSKINLNSAPVRLLESVLGVDAATARALRQSLPRPGEGPTADQRWLVHADELLTRGLLNQAQFDELPGGATTVFPIPGTAPDAERLNVNTAGPHVLAAAFDIDMEAARELAAQQPFAGMDDVVAAVGKDPATFAVALPGEASAAETTVLSLHSRCFRLRSTARIERQWVGGQWRAMGEMTLEAVVVFDESGRGTILSWRAIAPDAAEAVDAEPAEAEPVDAEADEAPQAPDAESEEATEESES